MGFGLAVDMIRTAAELGLLTSPYVFTEDEARAMAGAGADVLILHMGLTTKGSIGAKTALTLDKAARRVQALHDAARSIKPDILVLCHGGLALGGSADRPGGEGPLRQTGVSSRRGLHKTPSLAQL